MWLQKDKIGRIHVVKDSDDVIRRIFDEFLDGRTKKDIASGLANDRLMLGRSKGEWSGKKVLEVLRNPDVLGDSRLGYPQIVDTAIFEAATRVMEKTGKSGGE